MLRQLQQEVQLTNPLSSEEAQCEQGFIEEIIQQYQLPQSVLDQAVYLKLFPLMRYAVLKELNSFPLEEQENFSRTYTLRLTLLFGDDLKAIAYLERYAKQQKNKIDLSLIIHNACLFSLPDKVCNYILWRDMIDYHKPSHPSDLIMKLLPFANEIEAYVSKNRDQLVQNIRQALIEKYTQQFSNSYDQLTSSPVKLTTKKATVKSAYLKHQLNWRFEFYLRQKMGLTAEKLSTEERQDLLTLKQAQLPEDTSVLAGIESTLKEEETTIKKRLTQLEIRTVTPSLNSSGQSKHDYIHEQLKKAAKTIATEVKHKERNLLSRTTSLTTLRYYSREVFYSRAIENPEAAALFFFHGLTEESFNQYLGLNPQDDEISIPTIMIEGQTLHANYRNYYLKKLNPHDPRAAILGKLTSCCQTLGDKTLEGTGVHAVLTGITDPRSGFYVLCKRGKVESILAQCWAWRSNTGNIVFDSVESQIHFRKEHHLMITDFYTYLAHELVHTYHVPEVLVGTGGKTPPNLGILKPLFISYPVSLDSREQRLIAHRMLPLLQVYQYKNNQSCIPHTSFTLSQSSEELAHALNAWCDYCALQPQDDHLDYLSPMLARLGWNLETTRQRIALSIQWVSNMNQYELIKTKNAAYFASITNMLNDGVNVHMRNQLDATLMEYVAKYGWVDMMALLVSHGASVHFKNKEGQVTLHQAVKAGQFEMAKRLVELGADVNAKDNNDRTPLHFAIINGLIELIKWLVEEKNVNVHIKDTLGRIAYDYCKHDQYPAIQDFILSQPINDKGKLISLGRATLFAKESVSLEDNNINTSFTPFNLI